MKDSNDHAIDALLDIVCEIVQVIDHAELTDFYIKRIKELVSELEPSELMEVREEALEKREEGEVSIIGSYPVQFAGTAKQAEQNFHTHHWAPVDEEDIRCWDCDAKPGHAAAKYPCGTKVPRHIV